ncbi:tetratricopeptide repeat protein [Aestuariicella hydrocarbonica]|uniref:Tetratricopeptide repeat protein n=1 Tax=Pseudomaricurvus hydrocarbonicus TaxID=1470433 RepID=A0A9E5JSX1_9GAMM|nr:tetratricopeptide repeat protein [Aestuariicella hydrocarbonica]NHO64035.1 tetratricopeptide repeat protein [Aestuariicella hydrocarbonica]
MSQSPTHLAQNDLSPRSLTRAAPTETFEGGFEERSYLDAIAELEQHYGPYHSDLSQYLMGLGISYKNQGKHEEATEIFKRAMHVSRISEGLYSLGQVPILEHLIESNVSSGDWEGASESHQYLYWLYRRNYGEEDPRMLPAITKLSNWHLNAYALDVGSGLFQHLISAHNLYTMAVNIIDRTYGHNDMRLVGALKGLTVSNYYLATYQANAAKQAEFESSFSSQRASIDEKARLDQYILNSYSSGKRAISRIRNVYAANPEAPDEAEIIAEIQLADWNLLFNRWHTAIDMYQEAYNALSQHPNAKDKIDQYFGHPVALPDLPLLKGNTDTANDADEYVLARFNVSKHGQARNIEILDAFPENNVKNRSQVRKTLKTTKFRPRFENGEPAATENITHRYVFAN